MNDSIKNITHSVKARLHAIAKKQGREHQDLILSYLIERFLYRISLSKYSEEWILKGALMLQALGDECTRATRDIDFMSRSNLSMEHCKKIVLEIITTQVPDDGVIFDSESVKISQIQTDARQGGVRASFVGRIDKARAILQLDIGPYYRVIPSPMSFTFPQLLDFGSPNLLGYSAESIIADKFEAMVSRDDTNTRLKDFFDIWTLSKARIFEAALLREAISEIFGYYQTNIPDDIPICFKEEFYASNAKISQWKAFLKNANLNTSYEFPDVIRAIKNFLMPVCASLTDESKKDFQWIPGKGWQAKAPI